MTIYKMYDLPVYKKLICLLYLQSFVIAVIAMVIATFSTGIDSKCFQVIPLDLFPFIKDFPPIDLYMHTLKYHA